MLKFKFVFKISYIRDQDQRENLSFKLYFITRIKILLKLSGSLKTILVVLFYAHTSIVANF